MCRVGGRTGDRITALASDACRPHLSVHQTVAQEPVKLAGIAWRSLARYRQSGAAWRTVHTHDLAAKRRWPIRGPEPRPRSERIGSVHGREVQAVLSSPSDRID